MVFISTGMKSVEKAMDSSSAKICAFSLVIVATIAAIGVIVAAVILSNGDYGRDGIQCVSTVNDGGTAKALESSMVMEVQMMSGNTELGTQRARYNYDANTMVIEAISINGSASANVAIDYDRSVVFIELHSECLASALSGDMKVMADRFTGFMRDNRQQVIDTLAARVENINYARMGAIHAGYVSISNGPTIRGLCTGDVTQWTEQTLAGSGRRRKRQISISVTICIFSYCFTFQFGF